MIGGRCVAGIALGIAMGASVVCAQSTEASSWPDGTDPRQVGKLLADHFVASPHQYATGTLHYSEVVSWYGALSFARATHDDALLKKLIAKFSPLMPGGQEESRIPRRDHVDDSVYGIVPLEIAIDTGDRRYLEYGQKWADRQWEHPQSAGLSQETRFWVDDMYMMTILQVEAFRATGDRKYLDRVAAEMALYLDRLQRPTGLFFHAEDVPIYWGRGNGWAAAGLSELLLVLPADHPARPRILAGYQKMMAALIQYQGKDGMWRQIIDSEEAWPETSGSAMFAFAMINGVRQGWLTDNAYNIAARKAWIALVGYVDQNQDATSVCEGTNKKNDVAYYLARRRRTGDFHGQAPLMWAATALLR